MLFFKILLILYISIIINNIIKLFCNSIFASTFREKLGFIIYEDILIYSKISDCDIYIPANIRLIADKAFYNSENLKTVKMQNVEYIGEMAFIDCKIDKVIFSNNLIGIYDMAFKQSKVNVINLPDSTTLK